MTFHSITGITLSPPAGYVLIGKTDDGLYFRCIEVCMIPEWKWEATDDAKEEANAR